MHMHHSVLLDGIDENIIINDVLTALSSTIVGTWSCWVKPTTAIATDAILSFGDTDGTSDILFYQTGEGKLECQFRVSGTVQWRLTTNDVVFSDGVLAHIMIVQNGTSAVLYFNGIAVAQTFLTSTDTTLWFNNIGALDNGRIGCRNRNNGGDTVFYTGNIDEILFINRALNAAQALDVYNEGKSKDESSIDNGISYFRIDRDIVNICRDSIGSNDGTYVNVKQEDLVPYMTG